MGSELLAQKTRLASQARQGALVLSTSFPYSTLRANSPAFGWERSGSPCWIRAEDAPGTDLPERPARGFPGSRAGGFHACERSRTTQGVDRGTCGQSIEPRKVTVQGADAVEKSGRQHGTARHGECRPGPFPPSPPQPPPRHCSATSPVLWASPTPSDRTSWDYRVRPCPMRTVSPALGRIRETAKRDKRARFTALLHHITVDLLRWSFYQLKRRAAAGAFRCPPRPAIGPSGSWSRCSPSRCRDFTR